MKLKLQWPNIKLNLTLHFDYYADCKNYKPMVLDNMQRTSAACLPR